MSGTSSTPPLTEREAEKALNVLAGGPRTCRWCGDLRCTLRHCPWCGQLNEIGVHAFDDKERALEMAEGLGYVARPARPGPAAGYCRHVIAVTDCDTRNGWDGDVSSPFGRDDMPVFDAEAPADDWDDTDLTEAFGSLTEVLEVYEDLSSPPDQAQLLIALLKDAGAKIVTEEWSSQGMASSSGRIFMARSPRTAVAQVRVRLRRLARGFRRLEALAAHRLA